MILKCKKAGKDVRDVNGVEALCKSCRGEITIENNLVKLSTPASGFRTLPRKSTHGFNCPATIANPQSSDLV